MNGRTLLYWSRSLTVSQKLQWGRLLEIIRHLSMYDFGRNVYPVIKAYCWHQMCSKAGSYTIPIYSLWGLCDVPDIRPAEDNCKIHPHCLGY